MGTSPLSKYWIRLSLWAGNVGFQSSNMPEELFVQMEMLSEQLRWMGIPSCIPCFGWHDVLHRRKLKLSLLVSVQFFLNAFLVFTKCISDGSGFIN